MGRAGVRHLNHADRLVHAGAVDELPQQRVVGIVLRDAMVAVVDVLRRGLAIDGLLDPPAGQ